MKYYPNKSRDVIFKWCLKNYRVSASGSVFYKMLDIDTVVAQKEGRQVRSMDKFEDETLSTFWGKAMEPRIKEALKPILTIEDGPVGSYENLFSQPDGQAIVAGQNVLIEIKAPFSGQVPSYNTILFGVLQFSLIQDATSLNYWT